MDMKLISDENRIKILKNYLDFEAHQGRVLESYIGHETFTGILFYKAKLPLFYKILSIFMGQYVEPKVVFIDPYGKINKDRFHLDSDGNIHDNEENSDGD